MKHFNHNICDNCPKPISCCQQGGCHFAVEDFTKKGIEITFENMLSEFEKGYLSITRTCLDMNDIPCDPYYFVYTRGISSPIVLHDYDETHYPCMFFINKKCTFSDEERPSGGAFLIPSKDRDCYFTYEQEKFLANGWMKKREVMSRIYRHYSNLEFKSLFLL